MDTALPITIQALVAIAIIGVVQPYIVAFVTKESTPAALKSLLAGTITGLSTLGLYLGDVKGVPDWKHALGVFLLATVTAAGYRKTLEPGLEPIVQEKLGVTDA